MVKIDYINLIDYKHGKNGKIYLFFIKHIVL